MAVGVFKTAYSSLVLRRKSSWHAGCCTLQHPACQAVPDHSGLLRQTLIDVLAEGCEQACVPGFDDIDGQIEVEA